MRAFLKIWTVSNVLFFFPVIFYFLFFAFIFLFVSDFFLVQFFSRVYWILTCNNLFTCVFTCVLFQDFIISLTCVLFVKKCSLLEGEATLPSPVK